MPEKTNEITAIPVLIDQLAETGQLKGALVTIDAMGCQVEIAARIVAHKADFLLPLTGNEPTMEAEVAAYFETAPKEELAIKMTVETGHGRIETRLYTASRTVDWIDGDRSYPGRPRFAGIRTLLRVVNKTEYADRCTFDTRLYISSARSISSASRRAPAPSRRTRRKEHGCRPPLRPRPHPRPQIQGKRQEPSKSSPLEHRLSLADPAKEMIVNLDSEPWARKGFGPSRPNWQRVIAKGKPAKGRHHRPYGKLIVVPPRCSRAMKPGMPRLEPTRERCRRRQSAHGGDRLFAKIQVSARVKVIIRRRTAGGGCPKRQP